MEVSVCPSQGSSEEHDRTSIWFGCGAIHPRWPHDTASKIYCQWRLRPYLTIASLLLPYPTMQPINVIEDPNFRELLQFFGQGCVKDDEIPGRTHLTRSIIEAWKEERDQFYTEMQVSHV
jgi:hypothetical protein